MAAPLDAPIHDRVEPDRQEQDVLDRAEEQVPEPGERAAEPAGLDGVAHHAQADQQQQPAPGDARIARERPDQADGRQVGDRLGQKDRQGELAADLVPARVAVQEPAEAAARVDVLDRRDGSGGSSSRPCGPACR